jgi:NAD(P)-dependent dehydrogenase (short-subunit alcohol dehydrogenase family)
MKTLPVRVGVITGASSGIGLASAKALLQQGYQLLLTSRTVTRLQEAELKLKPIGGVVRTFQCDVSQSSQVKDLASFAASHWGRVDLLFNNAGTGSALPLEETTDDLLADMVGSSLYGTFYCSREFLPMLKNATAPVIINNASAAAHRGFANFAAYSAAKGGVASLSRALREELRPYSIRITTLSTGATASPFWDGVEGEWDRSRMMTCDSVGELIAYIAGMPACAQMEEILLMPAGGAL